MKIKHQEIEVHNERMETKTRKVVPAWETPIVQAIHPATEVIRNVCCEVAVPSVGEEYTRLGNAYGNLMDGGNNVSDLVIESVYGKGPPGVAQLRNAMLASRLPKSTPVTVFAPGPTLRKDLLQALTSDDVIGEIGEDKIEEENEAA